MLLGGIAIGFFGKKIEFIRFIGAKMSLTVMLMLFAFGLSIGSDDTIIADMSKLGLAAITISSLSVLGSVIAAWAINRFFVRHKCRSRK